MEMTSAGTGGDGFNICPHAALYCKGSIISAGGH